MKITQKQIESLVEQIIKSWKESHIITFKESELKVRDTAVQHIMKDYQKELELDKEVAAMLDQLERSNSGQFERHKMLPILKKKLAKEKKVVI